MCKSTLPIISFIYSFINSFIHSLTGVLYITIIHLSWLDAATAAAANDSFSLLNLILPSKYSSVYKASLLAFWLLSLSRTSFSVTSFLRILSLNTSFHPVLMVHLFLHRVLHCWNNVSTRHWMPIMSKRNLSARAENDRLLSM